MATIRALNAGEEVTFPWKGIIEPAQIRCTCSKLPGKFSVNKTEEGMKVTRTA